MTRPQVISVRLGVELNEALARSAEALGESSSEFIRAAVRERLERLAAPTREQLGSLIGTVRTSAGSSARSRGAAFTAVVDGSGAASARRVARRNAAGAAVTIGTPPDKDQP